MPGLNHVDPGGPALQLDLGSGVGLAKLSVGPMDNNAYLLTTSDAAVLIDAAEDADAIAAMIDGRSVQTIITTHRHDDHWQALSAVAERTRAQLVCGRPDLDAIATGAWVENLTGVWDGDQVAVGEQTLEVISVVGHTPGSIVLAWTGPERTHLFTGDSLFPGGPGKTWSPEDNISLLDDLESKVFARFDDQTVVHPGHGDDTTLGDERPHLPEWRSRGW